ncbi:MAG: hypothetical protein H7141_14840 [Burkholderiales bacterium]|nr:hypothetical protein [Bacteroidia bacterium]
MKAFLLIHGEDGTERSIENGFQNLVNIGKLTSMEFLYYQAESRRIGVMEVQDEILKRVIKYQPTLIIIFHVGKFTITSGFVKAMKAIDSKPLLVYDEGDIFGGLAKPITKSMKIVIRGADYVSIRGLGPWRDAIKKINPNIIYTPHCASISYSNEHFSLNFKRDKRILFIGNCTKSKLGMFRRLPGSAGREQIVKYISKCFSDIFDVYGSGWQNLKTSRGLLKFNDQMKVANESWFHFSFEHYPKVSHYYSDRLPISLLAGQIYICHYHEGYEQIFKDCDFIYFYRTKQEAKQIIQNLLQEDESILRHKSEHAHEFAKKNMLPNIVWERFFNNLPKTRNFINA